jgi:opacity protein-like surface antigen
MFKRSIAVSVSLLLSALPALAGGVAEPVAEAPAPAPAVTAAIPGAFGGWYGALDMGRASGSGTENPGPGWLNVELEDGNCAGGTLGRNQQRGRLVYGAELRHMQCTDFSALLGQKPFNGITDLRLRVGTTLGARTMIYGALGYSWVNFEAPFGKQTIAGPNAGLGIEINATDKVFAGVDYTARSLTGEGGQTEFDFNVATTTLRIGLRF